MPGSNNELAPFVQTAMGWAKFVITGLGSIALHFASKYWEAIRDSHPWSLYQAAMDKDIVRVKVRACQASCVPLSFQPSLASDQFDYSTIWVPVRVVFLLSLVLCSYCSNSSRRPCKQ